MPPPSPDPAPAAPLPAVVALLREIEAIGRDPGTGGYHRYAWSPAELQLRGWFVEQARRRGMHCHTDGIGNLWAWWGDPEAGDAIVTGSHLDSVPDGGGYDGPLGIASAFVAVDAVRARHPRPPRPLAVVAFVEEEGARFGVACLGSRLLTGTLTPAEALARTDADGVSLAEAMRSAGADPARLAPQPQLLSRVAAYVELHVEQGRALADLDAPVAVGTGIWPHGRWRYDFTGVANHAGTTRLADRRDPMLTLSHTVLAARKRARLAGAVATVGRVRLSPNSTNAVAGSATGWLDARAPDADQLARLVAAIEDGARGRGARDGVAVTVTAESASPPVEFDPGLRQRITALLGGVPELATAAGHDAGILAAAVPAAMLFVRNPTGASHTPAEQATGTDCAAGAGALAAVLADLLTR